MPSTSFCRSRRLFFALLGLVVVAAGVSFLRAFPAVMGSTGVQPIADTVAAWREAGTSFLRHPTVLWLLPADFGLYALSGLVILSGVALVIGRFARIAAFVGFGAYLSLFHSAPVEFMGPWDVLLIETLFLAGFFAPPLLGGGGDEGSPWRWGPHPAAHWLLRWLLFRVLAQAAWSRLDGDSQLWWEQGDGLKFALFTEPLPSPFGLELHDVGDSTLRALSIGWIVLQIVLAIAVLGPKWVRRIAFVPLVALFVGEWLLFNHGWLAPLCIVLSVVLLDDGVMRRKPDDSDPPRSWIRPFGWIGAAAFVLLSLAQWSVMERPAPAKPTGIWHVLDYTQPLAVCNSYPAPVATAQRVWGFEGREGAVSPWQRYEWEHLPSVPQRAPRWLPLHVPRLEYAMAFAPVPNAFQRLNGTWHPRLLERLFDREPAVLDAFSVVPFKGTPYSLRIVNYIYYPAPPSDEAVWQRNTDAAHPFSGEILPTPAEGR